MLGVIIGVGAVILLIAIGNGLVYITTNLIHWAQTRYDCSR